MNNIELVKKFDQCLLELIDIFKTKQNDYFFTEKELHSYFYHLCLVKGSFILDEKFNLIHTEYPTPFKCSISNDTPYFQIEDCESKLMRSHIDLILLNPNFIHWCENKNLSFDYVNGIRSALFSDYIKDFYKVYRNFYKETNQAILLYALEFKYFRHTYGGLKYPIQSIKQDIEKLKELKSFSYELKEPFAFCESTKAVVFVGDKNQKIFEYTDSDLEKSKDNYIMVSRLP